MNQWNRAWSWFSLLLISTMLDYRITEYGIQTGLFVEINPVMEWIIKHFGTDGIITIKMLVITILAICIRFCYEKQPEKFPRLLFCVKWVSLIQFIVTVYGLTLLCLFWWA
jgi:hypothetical protein